MQTIKKLNLLLWRELGTTFPFHRSWWMNVIWPVTSNNSDSDYPELCIYFNTLLIFRSPSILCQQVPQHKLPIQGNWGYSLAVQTSSPAPITCSFRELSWINRARCFPWVIDWVWSFTAQPTLLRHVLPSSNEYPHHMFWSLSTHMFLF